MNTIYLDYNATTPIDKEVIEEMMPFITEYFGNPSSNHAFGIKTKMAIEKAREQIALMIQCKPDEIVFTGGGTESNNLALKGVARAYESKGKHIIISAVEHPAVSEVAAYLGKQGFEISIAPVDETGRVHPETIKSMIRKDTILISVMHANNETGTIQPIKEIAKIAHEVGIVMHTDAAQSVGKIEVNVKKLDVDLLSIAGHKLYAPKGIGVLYIRRAIKIEKFMHGANHEHDIRPGTENVSHIVALGKSSELINSNLGKYAATMLATKNEIRERLKSRFPDLRINGNELDSLPNTLNISFRNLSAAAIMMNLNDVALSAGAACHSSSGKSGTLEAMKLPPEYALGAIRISTGRYTTLVEASEAAESIIRAIEKAGVRIENQENKILLTEFSNGMGCGCKMRPADLEYILKDLPFITSSDVLVSADHRDDAAVYKINDSEAIVQTVDFFTPMVDDSYAFGAIAAANALSDIYAMGAKPIFALNIVAFPVDQLPLDILKEIIRGATDKAQEAGIHILGGHSIEDTGIKFGMVVTGRVDIDKLLTNGGAKVGDKLLLTKPIGNGILMKALKLGMLKSTEISDTIESMKSLNKSAAEIMTGYPVNSCTDITGFGLSGHLHEMLKASDVDAEVYFDKIPLFEFAEKMVALGAIPKSTTANESFASDWIDFTTLTPSQRLLVCDAQTSGGLLISIDSMEASNLIDDLNRHGIPAVEIGNIIGKGTGKIKVSFLF